MKKQYYVDNDYDYKDITSALMEKTKDNVRSELYDMKYYFDKGDTAKSYEHYKNALAELNKLSFKEMENEAISVTASNWVTNYDQK